MNAAFSDRWRKRAMAGDAAAVALLADFALAPLYRFCFYRVDRNRHLCEEVVQQTLLTAIERIEQYEPQRSGNEIFGCEEVNVSGRKSSRASRWSSGFSLCRMKSEGCTPTLAIIAALPALPLPLDPPAT